MQVILKRPGEVAEVGELVDYDAFHDYIGGCFETVPFCTSDGSSYIIVCNDNFLFNNSHSNMLLCGVHFFGNIFICKVGVVNELGEQDFIGLDPADILLISGLLDWSEADVISLFRSAVELGALILN